MPSESEELTRIRAEGDQYQAHMTSLATGLAAFYSTLVPTMGEERAHELTLNYLIETVIANGGEE